MTETEQRRHVARWKRKLNDVDPQNMLTLLRADRTAHNNPDFSHINRAEQILKESEKLQSKRILSGHDIIRLGVPSGKRVGTVLNDLQDWQDGLNYIPTKLEAEQKAQQIIYKIDV